MRLTYTASEHNFMNGPMLVWATTGEYDGTSALQVKGATKLILSVFPFDDLPAFNLYKKLGFKEAAPENEQVNKNFYYMSYDCPKK